MLAHALIERYDVITLEDLAISRSADREIVIVLVDPASLPKPAPIVGTFLSICLSLIGGLSVNAASRSIATATQQSTSETGRDTPVGA